MNKNISIIEEKFGKDIWSIRSPHIIDLSKDKLLIFYRNATDIKLFEYGIGFIKHMNST